MNKLSTEEKVRVVACLVEGNSLRSTVRMTGVHRTTIQKFLIELGAACSAYQDKVFRNLKLTRIQCDEIWAFIGCKQKNVQTTEHMRKGWGDVWTGTALDANTKLIPCWYVGTRDGGAAYHFIHDLKGRLANRVQLTTDGHKAYLQAVEDAFGAEIDYAMLQKIYGAAPEGGEVRYSPAQCMGAKRAVISGMPDFAHISTSFTERQNLTMRMPPPPFPQPAFACQHLHREGQREDRWLRAMFIGICSRILNALHMAICNSGTIAECIAFHLPSYKKRIFRCF